MQINFTSQDFSAELNFFVEQELLQKPNFLQVYREQELLQKPNLQVSPYFMNFSLKNLLQFLYTYIFFSIRPTNLKRRKKTPMPPSNLFQLTSYFRKRRDWKLKMNTQAIPFVK